MTCTALGIRCKATGSSLLSPHVSASSRTWVVTKSVPTNSEISDTRSVSEEDNQVAHAATVLSIVGAVMEFSSPFAQTLNARTLA